METDIYKILKTNTDEKIKQNIKRVDVLFDLSGNEYTNIDANFCKSIVCVCGSCEFEIDDGSYKESIVLNRPDKGLYIGKNIWRVMKNFSYGCKLLALASDYYDEKEYIRDYNEFLQLITN